MTSEEDGEDDERDRQAPSAATRPTSPAIARRFGLGQVDVGDDERHERVAGRTDLGAKSRGRLPRVARGRSGRRGPAVDGGGPAVGCDGVGLVGWVVQDRAPALDGRGGRPR